MPGHPSPTIAALLAAQQTMTPIGRFAATWGEDTDATTPSHATNTHASTLPLTHPRAGEQYAFEVDLDACSGCKSCVSACHHLNGLDEGETWRSVGLLISPGPIPVLQHVTSACHHCLEPGCLAGCPTNAYEKDMTTGIVRHLDDQCFGCQYCTMTCPFDVPQYHAGKGIVRKCDLCHDRLAHGEAPACVQSCPNDALRIVTISLGEVVDRAANETFLPGAPSPRWTLPTTRFVGGAARLSEAVSASCAPQPQHAHFPLVCLLVFTQGAVGGFLASLMLQGSHPEGSMVASVLALAMAMIGLLAAPFHLGRPWLAYRAALGWRHSWMSREAIALGLMMPFGLIAVGLAVGYGPRANRVWYDVHWYSLLLANLIGGFGIYCSIRIYQVTQRVWWRGTRTSGKFWLTLIILALHVGACSLAMHGSADIDWIFIAWNLAITAVVTIKLCFEHFLIYVASDYESAIDNESLAISQQLIATALRSANYARFTAGIIGGIVIPFVITGLSLLRLASPATILTLTAIALFLALLGELCERTIFFRAVVPMTMPRSLGT